MTAFLRALIAAPIFLLGAITMLLGCLIACIGALACAVAQRVDPSV